MVHQKRLSSGSIERDTEGVAPSSSLRLNVSGSCMSVCAILEWSEREALRES